MSMLVRWIVKGLGWELGKTAAQEAVSALRKEDDDAERAESPAEARRRAKAAERAAADEAKQREREAAALAKRRANEAKERERAIDRELAALKKRVSKE